MPRGWFHISKRCSLRDWGMPGCQTYHDTNYFVYFVCLVLIVCFIFYIYEFTIFTPQSLAFIYSKPILSGPQEEDQNWLLCLICLPGVSRWLSGSSSRCHWVVCGL